MEKRYVTVTALNRYLKAKFDSDQNLQSVFLRAEISNFKRHSRGHLYFTLKDEQSQIAAVMFASQTKTLRFDPRDGSKVLVEGYVSVYEAYGNYQLYVNKLEEDGIGEFYLQFERLKKKLEAEGLFAAERKRPIPVYPRVVGVVTSPTGAAFHDIIRVINHRYPGVVIVLYPALVQGVDAKESIAKAIRSANDHNVADVLIVGRGGGSIEDLWAFNEEMVAHAIYDSAIPVIAAVGHETDFTIADFVADLRAATPSNAAELAVPDRKALLQNVSMARHKLFTAFKNRLEYWEASLKRIRSASVLHQPTRLIQTPQMRMDNLAERLKNQNPRNQIVRFRHSASDLAKRLSLSYTQRVRFDRTEFRNRLEKLELVNPLSIMKKGYSLVYRQDMILTSVDALRVDDDIDVRMTDGRFAAIVKKIRKDGS